MDAPRLLRLGDRYYSEDISEGWTVEPVEVAPVAERDRYRDALVRIADAESGRWGWIAYDALHPEREPHEPVA